MQTINDRIKIILERSGKTKTAFAESLRVSQQYISKLIKKGNPSDILIEKICQMYGYNEEWLRTGEGNPVIKRTKSQEIGAFASEVINLPDENIKRRLIEAFVKLDSDDWKDIERIIRKMLEGE